MALLEGIEMGLQAHAPSPFRISRQYGNSIDMNRATGEIRSPDWGYPAACDIDRTMLTDRDSLLRKLHELRSEHRDLDTVIARLVEQRPADQLHLQRLKKRKLMLKDEIAWLESRLIPDDIA